MVYECQLWLCEQVAWYPEVGSAHVLYLYETALCSEDYGNTNKVCSLNEFVDPFVKGIRWRDEIPMDGIVEWARQRAP